MKQSGFDTNELARFREVQRLAYACAESVARELAPGMTEKEAARRLDAFMKKERVPGYFHRPFAWFGDRTAFRGFRTDLEFFPSSRKLEPGMPVILDVAPVVDGYVADIGYSTSLGENAIVDALREDLLTCRASILEGVRSKKTFRAIYEELDRFIARRGYENAHRIYPQRVLAHRVVRLDAKNHSDRQLFGFGLDQFEWLIPRAFAARLLPHTVVSPLWNDGPESDHPPLPGLWAVEPHFAFRGVGAKWEEILVITEDDAYWLDDEVPHVRDAKGASHRASEVRA